MYEQQQRKQWTRNPSQLVVSVFFSVHMYVHVWRTLLRTNFFCPSRCRTFVFFRKADQHCCIILKMLLCGELPRSAFQNRVKHIFISAGCRRHRSGGRRVWVWEKRRARVTNLPLPSLLPPNPQTSLGFGEVVTVPFPNWKLVLGLGLPRPSPSLLMGSCFYFFCFFGSEGRREGGVNPPPFPPLSLLPSPSPPHPPLSLPKPKLIGGTLHFCGY